MPRSIVDSELRAFFENGVYDPDGHPGNWLIAREKREIVRIDYAQLRTTPEGEREAFKRVFAELIKTKPNFSSASPGRIIWPLSWNQPQIGKALILAIQSASSKVDFTRRNGPQEKLFALRNAIQDELSDTQRTRVHLSDTLRSGFALFGKISGFKEYLSPEDFNGLFAKYVYSRTVVAAMDGVQRLWGFITGEEDDAASSRDTLPLKRPRPDTELPQSLWEVSDVARDEPQSNVSTVADDVSNERADGNEGRYFTDMDFGDWNPKGPEDVYNIKRETYEKLPNGTECMLYSVAKNISKVSINIPLKFLTENKIGVWSHRFRLSHWWRPQNCGYYHRPSSQG